VSVVVSGARKVDADGVVEDFWLLLDGDSIAATGTGAPPAADEHLDTRGEAAGKLGLVLPQAGEEEASVALEAAARKEPMRERTPRVDWAELLRRTLDVFACAGCGGRRRVLAYVTAPSGVRAIVDHLGLPSRPAKRAPAQGPPQQAWC
jgi:hypothetical protein